MNLDIDYARRAPSGRPLASRHIDLITDGVASQSLKERGDRAVDHALMSTALSAVCRGMGEQDWLALILDPKRNLGKQARYTKGRQRTAVEYHSYLTRVWERAVAQGRAASLRDRDQYRIEARTLVERWDDVMPGFVLEMDSADALVLTAFLDRIAAIQSPRVAYPRRTLQDATGLPERTLRTRLSLLQASGVLRLEVRGRSSGPNARRRLANVYSLSAPERLAAHIGAAG